MYTVQRSGLQPCITAASEGCLFACLQAATLNSHAGYGPGRAPPCGLGRMPWLASVNRFACALVQQCRRQFRSCPGHLLIRL